MTRSPTFSIITVVLNDVEGIRRTETCLATQAYTDLEWIVVDGGSVDGSVDVANRSKLRRVIRVQGPDRGIYDAMNKGTAAADGRYLLYLNAGDTLVGPDVLARVAEILVGEQSACPRVLVGGSSYVLDDGRRIPRAARSASRIRHGLPACHQATFFPREFTKDAQYDTSLDICADYGYIAMAYRRGFGMRRLDFPIADFGLGGVSYQRPITLIREAAHVQRAYLDLGVVPITISASRRIVNMTGLRVLNFAGRVRQRWHSDVAGAEVGNVRRSGALRD